MSTHMAGFQSFFNFFFIILYCEISNQQQKGSQKCSFSGYEKQGDTVLDRLHKRRDALFCIFMYLDTPTLTQVCSISGYEKQGDNALDRLHKRRDALFCIFMYLDTPTLTQVSGVCKEWREVSRHPALWRKVKLTKNRISSKVSIITES